METKIQNMSREEAISILAEIYEYVTRSHAYLSSSQDYSRGYKDGIGRAKEIVESIIEKK
jgi:hypothetical protein